MEDNKKTTSKKKSIPNPVNQILESKQLIGIYPSSTDPQGSYTGVPQNPYEEPVQDADDL